MLGGRKSSSSFGPDGRRISAGGLPPPRLKSIPRLSSGLPTSCNPNNNKSCSNGAPSTNKLFQPGTKLLIQRAPLMPGLSVSNVLQRKFQRPMTKRRSYDQRAEQALKTATLGQKRSLDGMAKLMARAGKGLMYKLPQRQLKDGGESGTSDESDSEEEKEEERPFEPLCVWKSPHDGGEAKGLPPRLLTVTKANEYGIEEEVIELCPAPIEAYAKEDVYVPPVLAKWLRPHQREGVKFMYECVMGLKDFAGAGCILADDMGLGKTLQSVTLIWTLLQTGLTANKARSAKRVIVICPCSLVKNWDNEFTKWLGPGVVKTLALAESDRKTVEKNIDCFVKTKMFNVLIASYETIRTHVGRLIKYKDCCDLLVCDEAHRLKNRENQTAIALNSIPVKRRVLLTGTPMQNDLEEFYAMVDFTNPGILGTQEDFRRKTLYPILRGREPDATAKQKQKMMEIQQNMSSTVNDFILRRVNTLNAQHLPPKLVQVVCCNLTEIQQNMYQHLCNSKDMQHVLDGKQVNCLGSIQLLMKLCNHPSLVVNEDSTSSLGQSSGRGGRNKKKISYAEEEDKTAAAPGADGIAKFMPYEAMSGGRNAPVHPELSGKMFVLWRLMREMRKPGNGGDKIVIISNYTQTLDLIGRMCKENNWKSCRLDGSISMKKRQAMCDEFNDPSSSLVAFLLSSKAGGCGLNLIGGNRLVLFDPDWNPAVDKQAAARCWRDGQKKRCFTYRFLATGTVEEKIFQRQLSKEGLQSVVDDKDQVNALSTKDLKNLFKLRQGTPSDTHDKLKCERCKIIVDDAEAEAAKVLPKKLAACRELLEELMKKEDSASFLTPLKPDEHGISLEEYQKLVKQPMDFGTVKNRLDKVNNSNGYASPAAFSKDVNRVFANVMKVWEAGNEIFDAAQRLQMWWVQQWTDLVPTLMKMTADCDHEEEACKPAATGEEENDNAAPSLVERGEDYQEQLGMPEEEDMRSWSHHHSTDTVDDPIFRAAMHGYDTVSFVFGLEVTWSLIQEKQQEAEDKKALEELEKIDQLEEAFAASRKEEESDEDESGESDEDDDVKVGKADGDKKPAAKRRKKIEVDNDEDTESHLDDAEDAEEMADFIAEDSDGDGDDGSDGDDDTPSSDVDEDGDMEEEDDDDDVDEENPASGELDGPEVELEDSSDEENEEAIDVDMKEQEPEPEAEAAAVKQDENPVSNDEPESNPSEEESNTWACKQCTFANQMSAKKCEICGTSKRRRRS